MPNDGLSEQEFEREIQTLRDLRRRSISSPGPGALPLDPDLPPSTPHNRQNYPPEASTSYSSNDDVALTATDGNFWVPAHLHPELAPGEFRAFLKSHTHPDPENLEADANEAALSRSPSWLARRDSRRGADGGLGRKRSMLSRQYQPRAGDGEDVPPVPARPRSSIYGGRGGEDALTLEDLQKLEMMMEEAEDSDDPEAMKRLLRRSLSTNQRPGILRDDIPQGEEPERDRPRPGSIIRRTARTKIRKPNLPGDGGGHRFPASRRSRHLSAQHDAIDEETHRKSSDGSSESAHREGSIDSHEKLDVRHLEDRRPSTGPSDESTEEAVIFDAYRNSRASSTSSESVEHSGEASPDISPPKSNIALPIIPRSQSSDWFSEGEKTPTQEMIRDPMASFRRTSPGADQERPGLRLPSGATLQVPVDAPKPSSPTSPTAQRTGSFDLPPGMAPPQPRAAVPPGIAQQRQKSPEPMEDSESFDHRIPLSRTDSGTSTSTVGSKEKEKEKKGGFFSKKKDSKEKDKKKEKDGFLGGLFGSKKKVEEPAPVSVSNFSTAGPAAAAALLGSSKSAKSLGHPTSPSPTTAGFNTFARYPIHVERAVYRLSHIKLANARRPLYEQVLISNLMFWYLGVIGRNVAEEKKANGEAKKEDPENSKETAKPPSKGTPPKPADTGSAGQLTRQESVPPPREKKVGLTKPERARDGRNNEAPVRPPQYNIQNTQVDSEMRQAQAQQNLKAAAAQRNAPPPQQQYSGQPPGAAPPFHQSVQRAASNPIPAGRTGSPPHARPQSDMQQNQQPVHRDLQGPPRGVPQSSFGPPPPVNNAPPQFTNGPPPPFDDRRDPRQRTLSNPPPNGIPPGAQSPPPSGQQSGQMRRVVTDGRPLGTRSPPPPGAPHSSHAGPQPGQIFQYPGGAPLGAPVGPGHPFPHRQSSSPQPGQVFNGPQPGQIFHPPGPPGGSRPLPQMGNMPPGARPMTSPNLSMDPYRRPPEGYDPRMGPPGSQPGRSYPPGPPQGYPHGHPGSPPIQGPPQGFYRPPPQQHAQPGQVFGGYPGQPPNGDYRRPQPVPGQYQHHR